MKPSEIQVGKTYRNRGAGRTRRTVVAIGPEHSPYWTRTGEPGVLYRQCIGGEMRERTIALGSFARWAGAEVQS